MSEIWWYSGFDAGNQATSQPESKVFILVVVILMVVVVSAMIALTHFWRRK
jgi:hypothetical protein